VGPFDLVVIGVGIQGAAVARDAALRGLRVLLVDRRDIAAGTSSRSSRLVHGGLRYLRHGHLGLVREALAERERLLRLAPHLVRPQPMLMPFFDDSPLPPWLLHLGTTAYALLARRSTLPRPRRLRAAEAAAAFPGLRTRGLRSAIEFFDASTQDARLTLANVIDAHAAGAVVATHTEVVGPADGGLRLLDRIGGGEVVVRAPHVVNAAGPAVDIVRTRLAIAAEPLVRNSRGSHVVLPPRAGELALAAFLPDQRIQFVVPHPDGTLCGTTEVEDALDGDETGPPVEDLDYLMAALAHVLATPPAPADVRFAYAGWRALPRSSVPVGKGNREAFVVAEPLAGATLHTIVGGKLTTHRALAERIVATIFDRRDSSPTRTRHLPGGAGPREVDDPLWWRHGSRVALVRQAIDDDSTLAQRLCPHRPFLAAELVVALRSEFAVTLADAMLRRLVHGAGPCLEPTCLARAHDVFVRARAWPVDGDRAAAVAAVAAEVADLTGDLSAWVRSG
jgi:glycerol-3-phosphate dehydrogenase